MSSQLAALAALEYPGRAIILGKSPSGKPLAGYAITGRSPSSRARVLAARADGHLYTEPSDPAVLATGNPALLVYPAMMRCECGLVVSNGAQTQPVHKCMCADPTAAATQVLASAVSAPVLVEGIDVTAFEPDAPNFTPRITACVRNSSAAMMICRRRSDGAIDRSIFDVSDTKAGEGWLLTTYTGVNVNPLPTFPGRPVRVAIAAEGAATLASAIYDALAPAEGKDDLRVAAAAAESASDSPYAVINRVGLSTV